MTRLAEMKGCRTDKYRSRVLVSICKAVLAVPYLTTAVLSPDVYLVKFEAVISDSKFGRSHEILCKNFRLLPGPLMSA